MGFIMMFIIVMIGLFFLCIISVERKKNAEEEAK